MSEPRIANTQPVGPRIASRSHPHRRRGRSITTYTGSGFRLRNMATIIGPRVNFTRPHRTALERSDRRA